MKDLVNFYEVELPIMTRRVQGFPNKEVEEFYGHNYRGTERYVYNGTMACFINLYIKYCQRNDPDEYERLRKHGWIIPYLMDPHTGEHETIGIERKPGSFYALK